jgi:hypothetical protein
MKKTLLILLSFITFSIYSQNINTYEPVNIASFKPGNGQGDLGYRPDWNVGGIQVSPSAFTITDDGLMYVCDTTNGRVNIYDLNLKFINTIPGVYYVAHAYKIIVDDDKNIIAFVYEPSAGLIKIDKNGKELFKVGKKDLSDEVLGPHEYFTYKDYVFFYDNKTQEKITFIDNKGNFLKGTLASGKLKEINSSATMKSTSSGNTYLDNFADDKKIVQNGNRLISGNFDQYREFYKMKKEKSTKTGNVAGQKTNSEKYSDILNSLIDKMLIGFDKDSNSYWSCWTNTKGIIVVMNSEGGVLDAFGLSLRQSLLSVAPSGDIYLLNVIGEPNNTIGFYKITRRW